TTSSSTTTAAIPRSIPMASCRWARCWTSTRGMDADTWPRTRRTRRRPEARAAGLHRSGRTPHAVPMPELPEVETTRRGLAPHAEGARVAGVVLRRPDLRWPIPAEVPALLPGQRIDAVHRRAKYLLLETAAGSALLHLGMSGSLRVLPATTRVGPHDHVDI